MAQREQNNDGLAPGTVLGDYRVAALIAHGGMASVYRATQVSTGREVAVKVLAADLASQPHFVERFEREAKLLARLFHQNVVTVLELGRDAGHRFLAMEFVEGESLADRLKRQGRLPFEEAAPLLDGIAAGLEYAHGQDVLHRDIKPGNILITPQDVPKIADFGIARALDRDAGRRERLTVTKTQMGSALYVAPEQLQDAAAVDERADIYALGVVAYETLTGQLPMGQFKPASELVPGLPAGVDDLVRHALAPSPNERLQTVTQFRALLQRILFTGVPTRVQSPLREAARHRRQPTRKRPTALIAVGGALLAFALLALLLMLRGGDSSPEPAATTPPPGVTLEGPDARESQAKALLNRAATEFGQGLPQETQRLLTTLVRDYGDTAYCRDRADAITRLRARTATALGQKTAIPTPAPPAVPDPEPEPDVPLDPPAPLPGLTLVEKAEAAGLVRGLVAAYYAGTNHERFLLSQPVPGVDLAWGAESPVWGVPYDRFSTRIAGWMHVPETADYRLRLARDDGARLVLDGKTVIDKWMPAGRDKATPIRLEAGWHRLWVEHLELSGAAHVTLLYSRGGKEEPVPYDWFYCRREFLDKAIGYPSRDPFAGLAPDKPGPPPAAGPEPGQWTRLFDGRTLEGWALLRGGGLGTPGELDVDDGVLILRKGNRATAIQRTDDFPREGYDVFLEASRIEGKELLNIAFPVGDARCMLHLGPGAGLEMLNGKRYGDNITGRAFEVEDGRWYRVRIQVRSHTIRAWLDGALIAEIPRAAYDLDVHSAWSSATQLTLGTWETTAAVRNIAVRRLPGADAPKAKPKPAADWRVLVGQGRANGWERVKGGLFRQPPSATANGGLGQVIVFSQVDGAAGYKHTWDVPRTNYELSFTSMRLRGNNIGPGVIFPVGKSVCLWAIGNGGGGCGLDQVDGHDDLDEDNPTRVMRPTELKRSYRYHLRVSQDKVQAWINQTRVVDIPRAGHTFSLRDGYRPGAPLAFVGAGKTGAVVKNIRIRPLTPGVDPDGPATGWKPLFDGHTLDGWEPRGGSWTVQDSEIDVTAGADDVRLLAPGSFTDFHFQAEMKDLTPGVRMGIVCREKDGKALTVSLDMASDRYEAHAGASTASPPLPGVALRSDVTRRARLPEGQWHEVRIRCVGEKLTCSIDNYQVFVGEDRALREGRVGLFVRNGRARIRDVAVKALTADADKTSPVDCRHYSAVVSATVDGTSDLLFAPNALRWTHHNFKKPYGMRINGVRWEPQWEDNRTLPLYTPLVPSRLDDVDVHLTMLESRHNTYMQHRSDDRAVMRFYDRPPGAAKYIVEVHLAPTALVALRKRLYKHMEEIYWRRYTDTGAGTETRKFFAQDFTPAAREYLAGSFPAIFAAAVESARGADLRRAGNTLDVADSLRPRGPAVTQLRRWLDQVGEPILSDRALKKDFSGDWETRERNWSTEEVGYYTRHYLFCDTDVTDCTILARDFESQDFLMGVDCWSWGDRKAAWYGILFRRQPGRFFYFLLNDEHDAVRVGAAMEWKREPIGAVPGVTVDYAPGRAKRQGGQAFPVKSRMPHRLSIRCQGDRFECFVDGELVASGVDPQPAKGRVGFLVSGGGVRFRHVRVYNPAPLPTLTDLLIAAPAPKQ
ncbi:protein kinase [bacterium]|nr:protein kinase [bacterium]